MKIAKFSCLMVAALMVLASCGSGKGKSATTGWNLNDPKWGGFDASSATEQPTAPGLVFIEGGSFVMGHVAQDDHYKWDNVAHTVTVSSFYMDECEVSNLAYREFVYRMQRAYGEEQPEMVAAIMPDTAAWRDRLAWREGFVDYYFQSPNYNDYPVVGVSWEQAQEFCRWRTDRVNEKVLVDRGILLLDQENIGTNAFRTDVYLAGRYDGETRIRRESIDKHIRSLGEVTAKEVRALQNRKPLFKNRKGADHWFARFRNRLIAKGVGYVTAKVEDCGLCWAGAFPNVTDCEDTRMQMRRLDRVREGMLCKVWNVLMDKKAELFRHKAATKVHHRYKGRPFSYYG